MDLCEKNKCTLCGACKTVCPIHCISLEKDEYGFSYPKIDKALCIECKKCSSVCHIMKDLECCYPKSAYAVWSNDENDRKTSTSGGAASVFYQTVVNNDGVCYGAIFDDKLNVVIKGYSDDNILKFKNSKYVYSDMNDSYYKIKNDLVNNKKVIFIGLPCQVAAIKAFLKKDYENLILIDIICHGTPPQQYLYEHIHSIDEEHNKKTSVVKFRIDNEFMFMCFEHDKEKPFFIKSKNADSYLLSFFESLTYRETCYTCKYAQNNRVSDITIGDFWGLGLKTPFEHPYSGAISLVLINNKKGEKFFDLAKEKLFVEERTVEEGLEGNAQLNAPSKRNERRDLFLNFYAENGFEYATEKIYGDYMRAQDKLYKKQQLKNRIIRNIKKILRK